MRIVGPLILSVLLASCSSIPTGTPDTAIPVTAGEIGRALSCEFYYAINKSTGDGKAAIEDWAAFVEISLGAKDTTNIKPGLGSLSAKVGKAKLTMDASSATYDNQVEDKNWLTYLIALRGQGNSAMCPDQHSPTASTGLGVEDLLVDSADIINLGGQITSTASPRLGIAADGTLIGAGTTFAGTSISVPSDTPMVGYQKKFTVTRKVGGGLAFDVGDVSLTLKGDGFERSRENNIILVTMGPLDVTVAEGDPALRDFENSIRAQRNAEFERLRQLTPNGIIIVNPPATP